MKKENIFIMDIGQVLEIDSKEAKIKGTVPSGKVLVDGLGVGDVGKIVLRDRKHLSEDGMIIVVMTIEKETGDILTGPEIISRGFVYAKESEALMKQLAQVCEDTVIKHKGMNNMTRKNTINSTLRDYVYKKTKRSPMILPVIIEM